MEQHEAKDSSRNIFLISSHGGDLQLQHQRSAPHGDVQMDAWRLQEERKATKASRAALGGVSQQTDPCKASTEHIAHWAGSAAVSGRETGRGGIHTSPHHLP